MTLFWGRVECEAAVGSNVRSVPRRRRRRRRRRSLSLSI